MALKDIWQDLVDGTEENPNIGSELSVEPINDIAHAIIALEEAQESENENENVSIEIDDELSLESENPVQNKVIAAEIFAIKDSIDGVEEELQMINEGGIE